MPKPLTNPILCPPSKKRVCSRLTLVKLLLEEEEQNALTMTMGECLENMLHNRIFEMFCSYVATDKPEGFLPKGLELLSQVIFKVQTISILSQITVHPSVNHILSVIKNNLLTNDNGMEQVSHHNY
jgi:hypothetical protein